MEVSGVQNNTGQKKNLFCMDKNISQNIFFCVFYGRTKMGLGLEMHEGKYMITGFSFLGKLSPSQQCSTLVNSQCRWSPDEHVRYLESKIIVTTAHR